MSHVLNKTGAIILLLLISFIGVGQKTSDKLKAQQRQLEKKIRQTKSLIGETKNKERLTISELGIINQQIAYRNELLGNINRQIKFIDEKIENTEDLIESLTQDIEDLKVKYKKLVFLSYKLRNNDNSLIGLMAAEDLNNAHRRQKYIEQIAEFRKVQLEMIKQMQVQLEREKLALQEAKNQKLGLQSSEESERRKFENDKEKQRELLSKLKTEENKLKSTLTAQEKAKDKLARDIKKAIEKEIAAQAAKKNSKGELKTAPEALLKGKSFAANKGRLPWPVGRGEITGKFGKNAHPVLAGVYTQNNGIDITTDKSAVVKAVFKGTVSSIFVIPGAGRAVMLSHGNYRTVYANLKEVYVQKGDQVDATQELGYLLPGEDGKYSESHFEIWSIYNGNVKKENPLYWIKAR